MKSADVSWVDLHVAVENLCRTIAALKAKEVCDECDGAGAVTETWDETGQTKHGKPVPCPKCRVAQPAATTERAAQNRTANLDKVKIYHVYRPENDVTLVGAFLRYNEAQSAADDDIDAAVEPLRERNNELLTRIAELDRRCFCQAKILDARQAIMDWSDRRIAELEARATVLSNANNDKVKVAELESKLAGAEKAIVQARQMLADMRDCVDCDDGMDDIFNVLDKQLAAREGGK